MITKTKNTFIHSIPKKKVYTHMDDFSKTGMHLSESSMMMGSKLKLDQLSTNQTGVDAKYRWYAKMMGMTMDFSETDTKWQPYKLKEWEIIGEAKIIIML